MSATPQDVLREAARILMRDGWIQGALHGDNGAGHCAIGATCAARDELGLSFTLSDSAGFMLFRWLLREYGPLRGVAAWNDAPERTAEDVILALKRAAEES